MSCNALRIVLTFFALSLPTQSLAAQSVTGSISPPVTDVVVRVREAVGQRLGEPQSVDLAADGRFTIPWNPAGLFIEVEAPGHRGSLRWVGRLPKAPIDMALAVDGDPRPEPVRKAVGTTIRGQVSGPDGKSVAGAEIAVVRINFRSFTGLSVPVLPAGEESEVTQFLADATGRFAFRLDRFIDLPAENQAAYALTCRLPGRAAGTHVIQRSQNQDVACHIGSSGRALSGRLVGELVGAESEAGWPLHVVAATPGAPLTTTVIAGAKGRFTTQAIFADEVPGFLVLLDVAEARPAVVVVEPGGEDLIEVPVQPGVDLPVRVLDDNTGRAVDGGVVNARMMVGPLRLEREAQLDGGLHVLRQLPPETRVEINVTAPGHLAQRQELELGASASPTLDVRLRPASNLRIHVVDAAGEAVAGAVVEIGPDLDQSTEATELLAHRSVVTDQDGRALFTSVPMNVAAVVTSRTPGYAPWWMENLRLRERQEQLKIVLSRGGVIEGLVLFEDGSPVPDIPITAVRVEPDGENPRLLLASIPAQRETRTDEEGRFVLPPLAAGDYVVEPRLDDLDVFGEPFTAKAPPPLPVADGDHVSGVHFFLRPPVDVRLWLDGDDDLLPPAEARLTAIRRFQDVPFHGERITIEAKAEPDGSFLVENLVADVYDFELRVPGARPTRLEEVQLSGPETILTFTDLEIGAVMTLSVVNALGHQVEGAEARLFRLTANEREGPSGGTLYDLPEDHPGLRFESTDGAGQAIFDGLEPGDYQIHVRDGSGRYAYETWTLDSSEAEDWLRRRVVLPEGHDVPVRITAAGEPVAHSVVVLVRQEPGFHGIRHETQTNLDGIGRLDQVVPGIYQLVVHFADPAQPALAGREPEPSLIRIAAGDQLTLEF